MKKTIYISLSIILSLFIFFFILQNNKRIVVNILTWKIQGSLAWVILGSFLAGALSIFLIALPKIFSQKMKLKKAGKQLAKLKEEKAFTNSLKTEN